MYDMQYETSSFQGEVQWGITAMQCDYLTGLTTLTKVVWATMYNF